MESIAGDAPHLTLTLTHGAVGSQILTTHFTRHPKQNSDKKLRNAIFPHTNHTHTTPCLAHWGYLPTKVQQFVCPPAHQKTPGLHVDSHGVSAFPTAVYGQPKPYTF